MFKKSYKARHNENRMSHEGDVRGARERFLKERPKNLEFLLKNRFDWMNRYIKPGDKGMEVGAGTGLSKLFIKSGHFLLTDFSNDEWLDEKNVDAIKTPFPERSFDFIVSSNMIHHVPYPARFFEEMSRILKPGGVLLIQEINASFFMRAILKIMRHEGYSFEVNVWNRDEVCTDPDDLWSANCAIPNLLFDDAKEFQKNIPYFSVEKMSFTEFFIFLNSGGVIAKTSFIPLPFFLLNILKFIDNVLITFFPQVFALQRQVVLRKNG